MDVRDLHRMFDQLSPPPERERELLRRALQDETMTRRTRPMKSWKRGILAVAAAALLVTAAAAATVPGLSRRMLDYLGVAQEDTQTAELLLPGAMAVDITKEDNGAVLHVTQVLRDRHSVRILADFTAPEGTALGDGSFLNGGMYSAAYLDGAGAAMEGSGGGLVASYYWEVLEDEDPTDNRACLVFTLRPQMGEPAVQEAAALRVPAVDWGVTNFDWDREETEVDTFCSGDWSFEAPLPQKDIGWAMEADQVIGELDGAVITAGELYLSPMTFELALSREGGLDFGTALDEEGEAAYSRWLSIGNNVQGITLTTGDGTVIPLELFGGSGISFEEKILQHRLAEVTDPARFQGGTLTLEWDYGPGNTGSVTIALDNLAPAEQYSRQD